MSSIHLFAMEVVMNKKGISLVFLPFLLFLILAFRYTGFANELFEQIAHDIEDIPELDSTAHRSHLEVPLDKFVSAQ